MGDLESRENPGEIGNKGTEEMWIHDILRVVVMADNHLSALHLNSLHND